MNSQEWTLSRSVPELKVVSTCGLCLGYPCFPKSSGKPCIFVWLGGNTQKLQPQKEEGSWGSRRAGEGLMFLGSSRSGDEAEVVDQGERLDVEVRRHHWSRSASLLALAEL